MDVLYTAVGHATGDGRNGQVETDDGSLDLDVRIPKELGGPGGGTNPEELFALGYSACFHSAIKFVAMKDALDTGGSAVSATVGIGFAETGGFGIEVELDVTLPNLDRDAALALVERAHEVCPYSNATRGNIPVRLSLTD